MRDPRIDLLFPIQILHPHNVIKVDSAIGMDKTVYAVVRSCVHTGTTYVFDMKGRRFSSKKYKSKDKLPRKWLKWSLSL